jgi:hypothetical protein
MSEFRKLQKEICESQEEEVIEVQVAPCPPEQKKEEQLLEIEVEEDVLLTEEAQIFNYKRDDLYKDFKSLSKEICSIVKNSYKEKFYKI